MRIDRNSPGLLNDLPSGSLPEESTGKLPSIVRQAPTASKFSRPKPRGSIRRWHEAHVGSWRCASSCSRSDAAVPIDASFRFGTSGGGSGGGALSRLSRIHLPRRTGDVRVAYDDTVGTLACVSTPARGVSVNSTRRNSGPLTPAIP